MSNNILLVIDNELRNICSSPIIIVFAILMLIFSITNAMGSSVVLTSYNSVNHDEIFFYIGLGNFLWIISTLFSFLSICIGIVSFSNVKKGVMAVLLTKPMYRRDILAGKIIGSMFFLVAMICVTVTLFISLVIFVYGSPSSIFELLTRGGSFVLLLFLNCSLTLAIVVLLCIVLNKAEAMMASISYISVEYLARIPWVPSWLGELQNINPVNLYLSAFSAAPHKDLYSTSYPFIEWLNHGLPYIGLMIAEVVLMILISCILFIRKEV